MSWDEITNEEWREFQAIPEQGYSHRAWVDGAIRKRLDQLRTNEAIERVAIHMCATTMQEQIWPRLNTDEQDEWRADARAAIDALLGESGN